MAEVDAPLEVGIIRGHVIGTDQVINASSGPAHCCHDIIPRLQLGHVRANGFDAAESFMANHEEVETGRSRAVLSGIDFFVGAVDAHA